MTESEASRRILVYAAVCGGVGVLLGSVGAHGLDGVLEARGDDVEHIDKRLDQFDVGVRYHLYHALALLALAGLPLGPPRRRLLSAHLFVAGILLFSGSLYLLVLTDVGKWGMVTPVGGLCLIAAWLILLRLKSDDRVES